MLALLPHAEWSPDGARIAVAAGARIGTFPATGGAPSSFASSIDGDQHPSWSPDGTQIVAQGDSSTGTTSLLFDVATGTRSVIGMVRYAPNWGRAADVDDENFAPMFGAPACGSTFMVPLIGTAALGATIAVSARYANASQVVTLTASSPLSWATFGSTPGNPANGTITANPGLGDWFASLGGASPVVTITATDNASPTRSAQCQVTLRVRLWAGSPI